METLEKSTICQEYCEYGRMYKYRGFLSCDSCFDKLQEQVNTEKQEIIAEQDHKTARFKGLDLSGSTIGKVNREILAGDIEIAKKESLRLMKFEQRDRREKNNHYAEYATCHSEGIGGKCGKECTVFKRGNCEYQEEITNKENK